MQLEPQCLPLSTEEKWQWTTKEKKKRKGASWCQEASVLFHKTNKKGHISSLCCGFIDWNVSLYHAHLCLASAQWKCVVCRRRAELLPGEQRWFPERAASWLPPGELLLFHPGNCFPQSTQKEDCMERWTYPNRDIRLSPHEIVRSSAAEWVTLTE